LTEGVVLMVTIYLVLGFAIFGLLLLMTEVIDRA
jgi:hypothetical protein